MNTEHHNSYRPTYHPSFAARLTDAAYFTFLAAVVAVVAAAVVAVWRA